MGDVTVCCPFSEGESEIKAWLLENCIGDITVCCPFSEGESERKSGNWRTLLVIFQ